ncbi:hypothetical protein TWF481_007903 [Arthrobotrys musiformis]|uniref:Ankyrin repeat protein n=1 Tax=Arthrobotrys musiformis TaxID=47236 RepID=A0AAV9W5J8_9PEZI
MEAISVDTNDKYLNRKKIAVDKGQWKIIKRCGNLLEYNEAEETVSFFHYTLKQYITELQHTVDRVRPEAKLVDVANAICSSESVIATLCLTYLSFSDFETKVIPFQKPTVDENMQLIQQYASNLATVDLPVSAFGKGLQSIMRGFRLLNGFFDGEAETQKVKIDFSKYIYLPSPPSEAILAGYKFLEYVRAYWLQHCRALDRIATDEELLPQGFLKLCFEAMPIFDIRPWGQRHSQGPYPYTDAFVWAVENDHRLLLSAIKKKLRGADNTHYILLSFQDGTTLAHIAASHPNADTLQWLSERWAGSSSRGYILERIDSHDRNIMHTAVLSSSSAVLEYLFQTPVSRAWWVRQDIYGNTPFDYAIESGNFEILKLFNDHGCSPLDSEDPVSPGWSTDGGSSRKLESLFSLVCSLNLTPLYQKFSSVFSAWASTSTAENLCLLEGLKAAFKAQNYALTKSMLMELPREHVLDPEFKSLIVQGVEITIETKDHDTARYLLEQFGFGIPFRHLSEEYPSESSIRNAHKELYPLVIPSLLAWYLDTPDCGDIEATLLPDRINFGDVDPHILQKSLVKLNVDSFRRAIRNMNMLFYHSTPQLYEYLWHNISILADLEYKSLKLKINGFGLDEPPPYNRSERVGRLINFVMDTIPFREVDTMPHYSIIEEYLLTSCFLSIYLGGRRDWA